jgi:type VI secretion system protein ImpA
VTPAQLLDVDALLAPIAGENPAGTDLRYAPVYDKIRGARKAAESDERDAAAWESVKRLLADAIRSQSKDLQLGAWLVEAAVRRHGFEGAGAGLLLLARLIDGYWENLYPAIEADEDEPLGFRGSVLEGLDDRLSSVLKNVPLTDRTSAYGVLHYEASQVTDKVKKAALVEQGWPTSEQFDAEIDGASTSFIDRTMAAVGQARASLDTLESICEQWFVWPPAGNDRSAVSVTFGDTRQVLETGRWLMERTAKRRGPIQPAPSPSPQPVVSVKSIERVDEVTPAPAREEPVREPALARPSAAVTSREAAVQQLRSLITFLREDNDLNPLPYLLARSIAFAQLIAYDTLEKAQPLPAPTTALRQRLRALFAEKNWSDLLVESERAISSIEKQAWLDPHRFSIVAMERLGASYQRAGATARGQLRLLLTTFPDIADAELEDGTPAASQETQDWLRAQPLQAGHAAAATTGTGPGHADGPTPDAGLWEEAVSLVRSDKVSDALTRLQSAADAAVSGRERFMGRLRVAELCLQAAKHLLAFPILDELARIVEQERLDEWEDRRLVLRVWSALYRCGRQLESTDPEVKGRTKSAYARLCRLDPAEAMALEQEGAVSRSRR